MKILKISMLTLLLTLCAAAAVITIIHLRSGGGNGDARLGDYGSDGNIPVGSDITALYDLTEEEWLQWQRALERPSDSEYWHYYPDIPEDAAPGTTVVLNASAHAFVEWETDENYADVELFDQSSDGNLVYASFIMPDEKVVIRALYDDNLLFGTAPIEHGDLVTTASANIKLENGMQLPDAMVGVKYDITLNLGTILPVGTTWRWETFSPPLPPGFTFPYDPENEEPKDYARMYNNAPLQAAVGKYDFLIIVAKPNPDPDPEADDFIEEIYECSLRVLPHPEMPLSALPDGMVGVAYNAWITGITIPDDGRDWDLAVDDKPEGMLLTYEVVGTNTLDSTRTLIAKITINTPVEEGLYKFSITVYTNDTRYGDMSNMFIGSATEEYTIKIWPRPVITPRDDRFLDGIVGVEYNKGNVAFDYENAFTATHVAGAPEDWEWVSDVSGLPEGLYIDDIDLENAKLAGTPVNLTEAKVFEFRAMLKSTDTENPNIGEAVITSEPFYIKIWPLPEFVTGKTDLPHGMDGTIPVPADEPKEPEDWYDTMIDARRFTDPLTTATRWTWKYVGKTPVGITDPPEGLAFESLEKIPEKARIHGIPLEFGDFVFTIEITSFDPDNPNLSGAKIERDFDLKIWERRYLYSNIRGDMKSYVSREGEVWDEGDEEELRLRTGRRAVMPGDKGMISVFSNGGFVRWETVPGHSTSDVVKVGGPENYGLRLPPFQLHNYVMIKMPTAPDGDVYIHGALDPRPVIDVNLGKGTVGRPYSGYFMVNRYSIITGSLAVGNNVTGIIWSVEGDWPQDLTFGQISGIISGTPTLASVGTFDFTVCLTLPGTMIIERVNLSITIDPAPDNRGDVNNDSYVNLADLILLSRYFTHGDVVINMENADVNGDGVVNYQDLIMLARFFAAPGPLPPPSPSPSP